MSFVTLTKEEFENILPDYVIIDDPRSQEWIYEIKTSNPKVLVRVYSTVDKRTDKTRDLGKDAIRVVFWDKYNDCPIGKGKKILRTEGRTTIQDRIKSRIEEFLNSANTVQVTDFAYVAAILDHSAVSWMDFAQSLADSLEDYDKLTDNQLAYVLGDENPKGKLTFEARVLQKDPCFKEKFYESEVSNNAQENLSNDSREESNEPAEAPQYAEERDENGMGSSTEPRVEQQESIFEEDITYPEESVNTTPESSNDNIELIPTKTYQVWNYSFEEFNPVQSEVYPHRKEDKNMIIGANTSAGKTICAELLIDHTLSEGKRVIYLSPLKALTQEKYDDWKDRYPDETITILTGDYTLSDEMKNKLSISNIIVMTSEMADSRTRRMHVEKNYWLKEVGLVIVDESHILSTSRGHAVESGLMRFTKINPRARILFLSATMPNVGELGEWLTILNSKKTAVIYNTWRPVALQMHYHEYMIKTNRSGYEDYWASQEAKRSMAVEIAMSKPNEKFLIFCHDKGTGRDIVRRLKEAGVSDAIFHNADLDLNERLEVEGKFADRNNGIRVLVSTSTLAWGRNLPARNVIIVGIHRGINEVDQLDIIQMAGRAGRYGIDDEGHVYMIVPQGSSAAWEETFRNPRPVTSVLNDHVILAFHVLAEIQNREIKSVNDLFSWYGRSLAAKQEVKPFTEHDAEGLMKDLERMETITFSGIIPSITNLGKVSAWLYFSPYDVYAWYKNFDLVFNQKYTKEEDIPSGELGKPIIGGQNVIISFDDTTLAWAIGDIPSNDMGYVPKDIKSECDNWKWSLRNRGISATDAIATSVAVFHCLAGEDDKGLMAAMKRGVIYDIDRVTQALSLIDGMYAKWSKEELWKILPARVKYGIPAEVVPLTRLSGVGGKRAKRLWDKGFHSLEDIASKENKHELAMAFTPKFASKLQKNARELIN